VQDIHATSSDHENSVRYSIKVKVLAGGDIKSKFLWCDVCNHVPALFLMRDKIERVFDEVDANPRNWTKFLEDILDAVLLFIREMDFGTMGNQMVNKGL